MSRAHKEPNDALLAHAADVLDAITGVPRTGGHHGNVFHVDWV